MCEGNEIYKPESKIQLKNTWEKIKLWKYMTIYLPRAEKRCMWEKTIMFILWIMKLAQTQDFQDDWL